ncbi:MAG: magnesium transporter [Planctomycetota bacterium]
MPDRDPHLERLRSELARAVADPAADRSRLRELALEDIIAVADALDDFEPAERHTVFECLPAEAQAELLDEADESIQAWYLERLAGDDRLADIVTRLAPDDAADLIENLDEAERDRLLASIDGEAAEKIRHLGRYAADSAGGLMTPDLLSVPQEWTVQQVKDLIRARERIESIDNIFVTAGQRLLGVFSARELILADNLDEVRSLMRTDVVHVDVDADREEIYRVMETYHLSSIPVVDRFHDLVGVVTVDDVLTAGQEEASEDVFRMAGSGDIRPTRDSILGRVRKRLPYLVVSVFGGFGSALVLRAFGLEEVGQITYFLPMIVMLGGNIATQSSAVMVRGFATGEIEAHEIPRVILDELAVGFLVGLAVAVCGATAAYLIGDEDPRRIASAVLVSIVALAGISAILGTSVPSVCHRLDIDPAISAGPFITVSIDVIGCAVYLGLVTAFGVMGTT